MKALLNPDSLEALPGVRAWLEYGGPALRPADSGCGAFASSYEKLRRLTEMNVLAQLNHLKTYPFVADALMRERLSISGWVYDIGRCEVRIAEDGSQLFRSVVLGQEH
jgi:carbonic anhydrase